MRKIARRLDDEARQIEVGGQPALRHHAGEDRCDAIVKKGEDVHGYRQARSRTAHKTAEPDSVAD